MKKYVQNTNGTVTLPLKAYEKLCELAESKYVEPIKTPTIEEWFEKAKKEEGIVVAKLKGDYVGFLTSEKIAGVIERNINLRAKVEKLPKFIKKWYKLDK